ncbi:MAG: PolC-type DNA polymerase III [Bacillota bacterium]
MIKVIKPENNFAEKIKYIIVDGEKKICKLISLKKNDDFTKIKEKFETRLPEFDILIKDPLSLKEEINFIWPQIIKEVKEKFPILSRWLKKAELNYQKGAKNHLDIIFESKIAYKKAESNMKFVKLLENRLSYYLQKNVDLAFHNGDFLEEIKEKDFKKTKPKNKDDNFTNKKSTDYKNKTPKNKKANSNNKIIYGRKIAEENTHKINEIKSEKKKAVISGQIFDIDKFTTRNNNLLYVISITDATDSLTLKLFVNDENKFKGELKENKWIKVRGSVKYDTYSNELSLMANDIMEYQPQLKTDDAKEKRVELHLHTQMSAMDSVVNVEEVIKRAAEWGHDSLAVTDHGVVQAFPDAYQAGKEYGVKIIYGLEAYMVDDGEPLIFNAPDQKIADSTFVVFDLETTGLSPKNNEIIEIGAVKVKNNEIIDHYQSFVNPDQKIPSKITDLTGINNDMVADAKKIEDILDDFINFIDDSILVAHNADFDYSFLQSAFQKSNKDEAEYSVLDTLALSRALLDGIKNHKLNTLAKYFNVNLENHHRADDDAEATAKILLEFLQMLKNKNYEKLEDINKLSSEISWKELPTYHTIILAQNSKGLKDLYKLVSNSHIEHFYRKPRILKSELIQNRDNLLISSACESGQLYRAYLQNKSENEIKKIASFYDYLEIQPLGNNKFMIGEQVESKEELKEINKKIYKLGEKLNKKVVGTADVHFLNEEDKIFREILQLGQKFDDADQQPPLYYRTTNEMLDEFSYLGEKAAREVVIDNPNKIAESIKEMKPIPEGLYTPEIEGSEKQIREMSYNQAHEMYGEELPELVVERLEKELKAIIDNGYSVIYLISHKLVKKSLEDGYLVGSRGSVGSSLVATMCDITEVNPLPPHYRCPKCSKAEFFTEEEVGVGVDLDDKKCPECGTEYIKDGFDIPFEVFMGFKGDKVPDIDLNFSGEYQAKIHQETEKLFGEEYVYRAGTISTIADRTAFGFVKGYIDEKDLNLRKAEVNRLVDGCTGVRRTTGQHPGGLMVVPKDMDIHDFTPIQHPANDQETDVLTTHFDYHSISGRILKLDLLGHDDPTSLRMLQDITGIEPKNIPIDDPETMSIFSGTESLGVTEDEIGTKVGTLGIPEFGTSFVRQMLVDTKPTTFTELVRISGLSHGTDVWLNNAQELIKKGKAELSEVITVRDDIMNYLLKKGIEPSKAFWIMEHVRKGKGLTEEEEKAMRDNEVPNWYIDSCKKIKYMFPKAHAAAYVTMAFRIAYFKVHYPQAFYKTYFTIKAGDFDAEMVSQGFDYIQRKMEELENKGNDKTQKEKGTLSVLEIVVEAMQRNIEFKNVDLYESAAYEFKLKNGKLLPPLISLQGLGNSAAESIVESRNNGEYKSVEDLVNRSSVTKTVVEVLTDHGCLENLPEKNQLSLW